MRELCGRSVEKGQEGETARDEKFERKERGERKAQCGFSRPGTGPRRQGVTVRQHASTQQHAPQVPHASTPTRRPSEGEGETWEVETQKGRFHLLATLSSPALAALALRLS